MRRNIVLTILVLVALVFTIGCEKDILSPNANGDFAFNIESLEFTYTPGSRTGTMYVHNPTSIPVRLNIRIEDGTAGRHGVWINVGAHQTAAYDEYYEWGEQLRIEIHRDGATTVNYVYLGG